METAKGCMDIFPKRSTSHGDGGSQFASVRYGGRFVKIHVLSSVGSVGDSFGNTLDPIRSTATTGPNHSTGQPAPGPGKPSPTSR